MSSDARFFESGALALAVAVASHMIELGRPTLEAAARYISDQLEKRGRTLRIAAEIGHSVRTRNRGRFCSHDRKAALSVRQTGGTRTLQAKTFTYDGYGRVSSLELPQGYTDGSFSYDGEDETAAYSRTNAWCGRLGCRPSASGRTQSYSIRGELIGITDSTTSLNYGQASADGTLVTDPLQRHC